MLLYKLYPGNYYSGESYEINDTDTIPGNVSDVAPTEIQQGQYAIWFGNQWHITNESFEASTERKSKEEEHRQQLLKLEESKNIPSKEVYNNWNEVREHRNRLLLQSDWTQLRDIELLHDADWKAYRKALRDIPQTYAHASFEDIIWPDMPLEG